MYIFLTWHGIRTARIHAAVTDRNKVIVPFDKFIERDRTYLWPLYSQEKVLSLALPRSRRKHSTQFKFLITHFHQIASTEGVTMLTCDFFRTLITST